LSPGRSARIAIDRRGQSVVSARLLSLRLAPLLFFLLAPVLDGVRPGSGLGHALPGQLSRVGDVRDLSQSAELLANRLAVDPVERLPGLEPARRVAQAEPR